MQDEQEKVKPHPVSGFLMPLQLHVPAPVVTWVKKFRLFSFAKLINGEFGLLTLADSLNYTNMLAMTLNTTIP